MKNGSKIFDKSSRSNSAKQFSNITSPRRRIFSSKGIFSSKNKFERLENKNQNNRYIKNNRNNKFSTFFVNDKDKIFKSLEINRTNKNEKSSIINKSNFEYNKILSLLDKIMEQDNSFEILIKIKNFINKILEDSDENKYILNSKSCLEIKHNREKENDKEEEDLEENKYTNLKYTDDKTNNKNYLSRRVKKLYHKINELEAKSNIEQLKYLFFIVEQEKKIAELEKKFEIKEIPLDERIIEKMRELKCYPTIIRSELITRKKNNLYLKDLKNKVFSLRSRNKKEIEKEDSFDKEKKEKEFTTKKNESFIMNQSEIMTRKKPFQFSKINKDFNSAQLNRMTQIKNNNKKIANIMISFSKPVNQFFNKKNFFVTHPKLNYVKDSLEKNHFLKLKTKEQLSGESNLLSSINLANKSQKNALNDFSNYVNNSMANFEKIKL